jgi:hypothetical protein
VPIAAPTTSEGHPPTPVLTRDPRTIEQVLDHGVRDHQVLPPEDLSRESSGLAPALCDPPFHPDDPLAALRKICSRFHLVARQLRLRRDYRATLEIEDEYDVQDLLYALLRLEFEEVGNEDWCPSYGDGATRTSYLLYKERVVIVAKKTKTGVPTKELVEQVRIDSTHFSGRADCRTLVCFIYDPEGRVGNPRGLESDLTMVGDTFTLEVIIAPK